MKTRLNKFLSIILVAVMLLSALPFTASAEELSGTCGDNLTWSFDESTGELAISGTGEMYDYDLNNDPPWDNYRSSIKKVTIGGSVTNICDYAFNACSSLTSVTIGNSVTNIGNCAFTECYRLTSIIIPDSVSSIGSLAFSFCLSLTSITIGKSVTNIGNEAFWSSTGLTNIIVDENNTAYSSDEYGVLFNKDKTELIQYPIGNTRTSYEIPDSVTSIENEAFFGCTSLTSVTIPDCVTAIGTHAFRDCDSLTSVIIGNGVASIGDYAFCECTGLTSVIIGNSVTSIGDEAFFYCTSLTDVTIPDSVTTIGDYAFDYCIGLTDVYYNGSQEQWDLISIGSDNTLLTNATIHFTELKQEIASGECGDNLTWTLYDDGELSITGTGTMYNYYNNRPWESFKGDIKSVIIGDGVTSIGSFAFEFSNLESVTIPDSIKNIGGNAFSYCQKLTSITIPDGVTTISGAMFQACVSLIRVSIPDSVTSLELGAFVGCSNLTEITIPDSVTTIGDFVFLACSNLSNVTLPLSVQSVGNKAFSGCEKMEKLKVYNSNCTFGTEATSYYTTIVGYAGSTAEAYANENGFDFELIADDDHEHIYSNGCDNECNICGFIRTDLVHTYTYVCDIECDLCGHIRTGVIHTYSNDCDFDCDICGNVRTELVHTYSNGCDPDCDFCGNIRTELSHTDENIDGLCDVCEKAISDILVGVEQNFKVKVGETVYIKFVPANSGVYTFYSSSTSDTYGYIYDADKNQLRSDDDSGGNGNFSITYTFKAGTVYYLGVRYFSPSNSGEIPVTLRLDELICDHNNTHSEHKDSTCSEYGYDKVICDDCGATISETVIDTKPHSYKTVVANPTCQSVGTSVCVCDNCGYAYIDKVLSKVDHLMSWEVVSKPTSTADGEMHYTCEYCGLVEDTKVVPAFCFSTNGVVNINFENNTISGFDAGSTSLDGYVSVENGEYTFVCDSAVIGTGTVIELTDGDVVVEEFTAVVFGDVNGDGWYDGTDSIIVSCLANGLLSKDDVSPAFYTAADCNHDGVIDSFDVAILEQAGLLLSNVDQSKSNEELATDEAFIEYLDLIDQTPEDETVEDEIIETPEVETETEEFDFIEFIITIIKEFFELLLSTLPIK